MRTYLASILSFFLLFSIIQVYALTFSDTGYDLTKGYKVSATIHVPDIPWVPTEVEGGVVGISTSGYSILVKSFTFKGWLGDVYSGFKVIKIEGGKETVLVDASQNIPPGVYNVYIVWTSDNKIKFSYKKEGLTDIEPQLLYTLIPTVDSYDIVASNADVSPPEKIVNLPGPIGEGYQQPITYSNIYVYALGGIGALLLLLAILIRVRR